MVWNHDSKENAEEKIGWSAGGTATGVVASSEDEGKNYWTGSKRSFAGKTLVIWPSEFHKTSRVEGAGPAVVRKRTPLLLTCQLMDPRHKQSLFRLMYKYRSIWAGHLLDTSCAGVCTASCVDRCLNNNCRRTLRVNDVVLIGVLPRTMVRTLKIFGSNTIRCCSMCVADMLHRYQ